MIICVYGLWHLGSVTAACLAEHFEVIGCDPNPATILEMRNGQPPVFEPGLAELIESGTQAGKLSFSCALEQSASAANVVWVTFDTPVDAHDAPDDEFVRRQTELLFPHLANGTIVLISSQVPVGCTRKLETAFRLQYQGRAVTFAYSPENLRLGKAIEAFRHPARIVVGVRSKTDQAALNSLFAPFSPNIEWMSVESAEMTKHAVNSFLATSVAYINELASLCELTGADAKEVERGLKTEPRIGPGAYLTPGAAFAGGTLARDVVALQSIGTKEGVPTHLLSAVTSSNDEHKKWPQRQLTRLVANLSGNLHGNLFGKTIAVLGLAYRPGTDTLRRSSAIELCIWLAERGVRVQAFDPAVKSLPAELDRQIRIASELQQALCGAHAAVVMTECPAFRSLLADDWLRLMNTAIVVDPSGFLAPILGQDQRFRYASVGRFADSPRASLNVTTDDTAKAAVNLPVNPAPELVGKEPH